MENLKVYEVLRFISGKAIITIEPENRENYFIKKMKRNKFRYAFNSRIIEQFTVTNVIFDNKYGYGVIIQTKENIYDFWLCESCNEYRKVR